MHGDWPKAELIIYDMEFRLCFTEFIYFVGQVNVKEKTEKLRILYKKFLIKSQDAIFDYTD